MNHESHEERPTYTPKLSSYILGYGFSLILTAVAFALATNQVQTHTKAGTMLLGVFVFLALVQLAVQAIFFLHLNSESKPRWNSVVFGFAVFFVATVVLGSLWIMNNLRHGLHKDMFEEENISPEVLDQ